ncbi:hypothetical protein [Stenotrophomonas maltophilia]|uniref:hypothetical protein n=1 Tax=Stenotrophomonas maltophilia TaxID=40324 RepID=UPI001FA6D8FD|nr:hypothetical protein [Stenotrophomonas maltophilia]
MTEEVAIAIERAVASAMAENQDAAKRADTLGGRVTADELIPDVRWERDAGGAIVGYYKSVGGSLGVTNASP